MVWQITLCELERGWGPSEWTEFYDTRLAAEDRIAHIERAFGNRATVPDYYIFVVDGPRQVLKENQET